jgi:hypothetical protein
MAAKLDAFYPGQEYSSEGEKFRKLAVQIKENYNRTFYRKDLKRYADGLNSSHAAFHSSFFPVFFGLVPDDLRDEISNYLVTRDMDCGVFGSQFFLWALYKLNQGGKALDLIVSQDENSWFHVMHELNAANTTEAWDPKGKPDMSKSHSWGGSAGNMIQRGLMGINPLEPGFKKISIKPQTGDLEFANIDFPTVKGTVHVNVVSNSNSYSIEINIPANTTAKVYVRKLHGNGTEVEVDGSMVDGKLDEDNEFIVFDGVGSGTHIFRRTFNTIPLH